VAQGPGNNSGNCSSARTKPEDSAQSEENLPAWLKEFDEPFPTDSTVSGEMSHDWIKSMSEPEPENPQLNTRRFLLRILFLNKQLLNPLKWKGQIKSNRF